MILTALILKIFCSIVDFYPVNEPESMKKQPLAVKNKRRG